MPGSQKSIRPSDSRAGRGLNGRGPVGEAAVPGGPSGNGDVVRVPDLIGAELPLAELERRHILAVLARLRGNRSRAAEVLGIPRRTLYRRLEEYGLLGDG
jgi:transcriptional regulator of acetoin/glycerol metabolism